MKIQPATGDYEVDRQRHAKLFFERLPTEVDKLTWPLEKLHQLRNERFVKLIRHAKEHSPWHAKRLKHINPDTFKPEQLAEIPTMTKTDLMDNWDEIVTDRRLNLRLANEHLKHISENGPAYLLDQYHVVTSGGSSGVRGVFVADFEAWLTQALAIIRHGVWLDKNMKWKGERRDASVGAGQVTHGSIAAFRTFFGSHNSAKSLPITLPFDEIIAGLNEYKPTHLIVYPSMLHRLALEKQAGRLDISPQSMMCVAEPLLPEARLVIEQAFGKPPMNMYGCSECGAVGHSYPGSTGMHLAEDTNFYEPVDEHRKPVPLGQTAPKMIVTNVANFVLPLIRYELTDEVMFLDEPNPDLWTGRRIADVRGRSDNIFTYPNGVIVPPLLFWTIFGKVPEIFEYQVRQTRAGVDVLVRTLETINLENICEEIRVALLQIGLTEPQVELRNVDHIERHAETGKLKHFVPLKK